MQKVGQNDGTFGEIAAAIHSMVFKEGSHSSRNDIVFGTYRDMSITNVERNLRVMIKAYNGRTYLSNSGRSFAAILQ